MKVTVWCLLALSLGACASLPHRGNRTPALPQHVAERLPAAPPGSARHYLVEGLGLLHADRIEEAQRQFNRGLKLDPQDPHLNFLVAYTYHLGAAGGNHDQLELAEVGYNLALGFDPGHWLAAYHLGRLQFERRDYRGALNEFGRSLSLNPDEPRVARAVVASAYHAGDAQLAMAVLDDLPQQTSDRSGWLQSRALIAAAVGDRDATAQSIEQFRVSADVTATQRLERRVIDWERYHQALDGLELAQMGPVPRTTSPTSTALPSGSGTPAMAILDVTLIARDDASTTSQGVNLLEGLKLQFGSSLVDRSTSKFEDLLADQVRSEDERTSSSMSLSVPAITYSLNMANAQDSYNRLVSRPSVLVYDGVESELFLGAELTYATGGQYSASFNKEVGLSLRATPSFLADGQIRLRVQTQFDAFSPTAAPGNFTQAVATSKSRTNVTAQMRFDQTLVIAGGDHLQVTDTSEGVPILRRIPGVQYLFSRRGRSTSQSSVLVLITPRRTEAISAAVTDPDALLEDLRAGRPDLTPGALEHLRQRYGLARAARPNLLDAAHGVAGVVSPYRQGDIPLFDPQQQEQPAPGRRTTPAVINDLLQLIYF